MTATSILHYLRCQALITHGRVALLLYISEPNKAGGGVSNTIRTNQHIERIGSAASSQIVLHNNAHMIMART